MYTLLKADAIAAVRKNLDEVGLNESVVYNDENVDNDSLDLTIAKSLPEAINDVHLTAPVQMLEGEKVDNISECSVSGRVLSFSLDERYLRLVAFRAADSPYVVSEVISEYSPEGRKQLNPYVRGTWDKPRLVLLQDKLRPASFRYYTLKDDKYENYPFGAIADLSIIREQVYSPTATGYPVSAVLRENILLHLTGLVLAIYGENEKANYFLEKAKV